VSKGIAKNYFLPLLVLTAICLVVSAALAMMDGITRPEIEADAAIRTQRSMSEKIPEATGFEPLEPGSYDGMPATIRDIYKTTNDVGYVFIAAVNGFSGDILIICGIDPDGKIIGTSTLAHTETKGIGTILEQESFLGPFTGLDYGLEGIDTVTGATISTRAFIRGINDIFTAFYLVES